MWLIIPFFGDKILWTEMMDQWSGWIQKIEAKLENMKKFVNLNFALHLLPNCYLIYAKLFHWTKCNPLLDNSTSTVTLHGFILILTFIKVVFLPSNGLEKLSYHIRSSADKVVSQIVHV